MPVDIETEIVQLWAGSQTIGSILGKLLATHQNNLTTSVTGLRSGLEHRIVGLSQIMELSQSFTLEIAIKALYRSLNPNSNPENTHDLLRLFESLGKDVKSRIRSRWQNASGRSAAAQSLSYEEFLGEYRLMFEESRYLYERNRRYSLNFKDFDIAILVIIQELLKRQPDSTLLLNLWSVFREKLDGSLSLVQSQEYQKYGL